jgi:hypothetical protein
MERDTRRTRQGKTRNKRHTTRQDQDKRQRQSKASAKTKNLPVVDQLTLHTMWVRVGVRFRVRVEVRKKPD